MNLNDNQSISEEVSKNIKLILEESVSMTDNLDSVYKIVRKGDIAYLRSDYP